MPIEQPDFFLEQNPELKERYDRTQFKVGLLGGSSDPESVKMAEDIAYDLTKNYHRVVSGGYKSGVMGSALKGAERAIQDLYQDPDEAEYLGQLKPMPIGVTIENLKQSGAVRGKHIQSKVVETFFDRKAELVTAPSAFVIFEGGMGSGAEVTDTIQHNLKIYKNYKPMIFVGKGKERYNKLLKAFGEDIKEDKSKDYIHYVENKEQVEGLLKIFYDLESKRRNLGDLKLDELELLELSKPFRDKKEVAGKELPVKFVVDLIIKLPDGKIRMIKRAQEPFMDKLCLAGGHIEKDETASQAALREGQEETGSDLSNRKSLTYVGYFNDLERDVRNDAQRISLGFMIDVESANSKAGGDAREIIEVNPSDLKPDDCGFDHYEIIKASIKKDEYRKSGTT